MGVRIGAKSAAVALKRFAWHGSPRDPIEANSGGPLEIAIVGCDDRGEIISLEVWAAPRLEREQKAERPHLLAARLVSVEGRVPAQEHRGRRRVARRRGKSEARQVIEAHVVGMSLQGRFDDAVPEVVLPAFGLKVLERYGRCWDAPRRVLGTVGCKQVAEPVGRDLPKDRPPSHGQS